MLNLTKENVRELILSAYESGWSGSLEFKSEYADQVMQQFNHEAAIQNGSSTLTVAVNPIYSISSDGSFSAANPTFIPGYYSTFTQTSPVEAALADNPGQDAF